MPSTCYDSFETDVHNGDIVLDSDPFYVMLTTVTYAEDAAAHTKRSDITNEVTGTNYTAGGVAVVPTVTKDTANSRTTIVFPSVTFSNVTITGARKAVYYKSRGGLASADELVLVNVASADKSPSGVNLVVGAATIHIGTPAAA